MLIQYFDCICKSPEHVLRVVCDDLAEEGEDKISIDCQFYPHTNIFKRIWIALKYVFKPYGDHYPWGDTIINNEDLDRFIGTLQSAQIDCNKT